jgi:hypothetical protein
MITQDRLKELFTYSDGNLIRNTDRGRGENSKRWSKGTRAGHKTKHGYVLVSIDYKHYKLHRLIWLYHHGKFPEHQIDHIDGDPSNNKIENLREATSSQNMQNQQKPRKTNRLGVQGVCINGNRYRAALWLNKKRIHIGYFDSPHEAHEAYVKAKRTYHPYGEL